VIGNRYCLVLEGISDEKDWSVETDDIIVTFLSIEFDCEITKAVRKIGKIFSKGNSTESEEERSLLPNIAKKTLVSPVTSFVTAK